MIEDRLKKLRKTMDQTSFANLNFSEQHRRKIHEKINKQDEREEDILLAIMQLLVQEKTGFELISLLRGRGIQAFDDNEGFLYTLLHRLEQSGCLQSGWDQTEVKYYQISDKGRKLLRKAEKSQVKRQIILKEVLGG